MKFSIITICYNPGPVLRSAVESVLAQSYKEVEYIIVDGGSTDGTVDWLSDVVESEPSMRMVSEPDKGLYDALNKGVRLATGDVIGFVHADDFLAHEDVLKHVAEAMTDDAGLLADALYGDLQYVAERCRCAPIKNYELGIRNGASSAHDPAVDEAVRASNQNAENLAHPSSKKSESSPQAVSPPSFAVIRHWESGEYDPKMLKWGWMPPHPTLYLKREVYERARLENSEYFDTSFSCSADYDFMMRVLSSLEVTPVYLPEVMVRMRVGGVSNRSLKHIIQKSKEDWRAIRRNEIGHLHTLAWKNLSKVGQFRCAPIRN